MFGYSTTPLLKKLGIKPGYRMLVYNEPENYWNWIAPLPEGVKVFVKNRSKNSLDFIHVFVPDQRTFEKVYKKVKPFLKKDGMLWVSWPKKSSGIPTDLDENVIRDFGLTHGLVDVKVCAVDEIWSGLKFMFRLTDR